MINLRPCPFCEKIPIVSSIKWSNSTISYRVLCANEECHIRPKTDDFIDEEIAIEKWNTRPGDKRKADLLSGINRLELKIEELDQHLKEKDLIIRRQGLIISELTNEK